MAIDQEPSGSYGGLTRTEFQALVNAPYGRVREFNDGARHALAVRAIEKVIRDAHLPLLRHPSIDEDFVVAEMVTNILETMDRWGLLAEDWKSK